MHASGDSKDQLYAHRDKGFVSLNQRKPVMAPHCPNAGGRLYAFWLGRHAALAV